MLLCRESQSGQLLEERINEAGALAVMLDHAMRRMLVEQRDGIHCLTLMNESQPMPSLPVAVYGDLLRGMHWAVG